MKEGIFDVRLMKKPMKHSGKGQNKADKGDLSNTRKCMAITKAKNLSVSFGNKASLKEINLAVMTNFNSVNPATTNSRLTFGKRYQVPSLSGM